MRLRYSNSFTASENLNERQDINRAWKTLNNIKISGKDSPGLYELKQHKPWFDEECSRFLDQGSRLKRSGYRIQPKAE